MVDDDEQEIGERLRPELLELRLLRFWERHCNLSLQFRRYLRVSTIQDVAPRNGVRLTLSRRTETLLTE